MKLYSWQEKCISAWEDNDCRGIVDVVTGAGKTVMAIMAAERLRSRYSAAFRVGRGNNSQCGCRIKIVVPNIVLAKQWAESIRRFTNASFGFYYGGRKDTADKDYKIYVINSARYSISRHIVDDLKQGHHVLLIADECHHYGSEENRKIFSFMKHFPSTLPMYSTMGLSATPECKEYEGVLVPALGDKIFRYSYEEAVRDGIVSPFYIYQIDVDFYAEELLKYGELSDKLLKVYGYLVKEHPDLKKVKSHSQFYDLLARYVKEDGEGSNAFAYDVLIKSRRKLCHNAQSKYDCLEEIMRRRKDTDKVIIFCERIAQNDSIIEYIRQRELGVAVRYHSEMTEEGKRYSLSQFKEGCADTLVTCRALDEGMDVPEANIAIVMSGTMGSRQKIQRLGRILRRSRDKKYAVLYYMYMGQSMEEGSYIDMGIKANNARIIDVKYNPMDNKFICEKYEKILWDELCKWRGTEREKEIRKLADRDVLDPEIYLSDWGLRLEVITCEY